MPCAQFLQGRQKLESRRGLAAPLNLDLKDRHQVVLDEALQPLVFDLVNELLQGCDPEIGRHVEHGLDEPLPLRISLKLLTR